MPTREPVVFIPGYPGVDLFDLRQDRRVFPPPYEIGLRRSLLRIENKADVIAALKGPQDPTTFDGVIPLGPIDVQAKILGLEFGEEAKSLYDVLEKLGYDPLSRSEMIPVGWDWRLPVAHADTVRRVAWAVDALFAETGRTVTILAHSTGGLVARAYLASAMATRPISSRVARVLALAVPWAGTLKTLKYLRDGSAIRDLNSTQVKDILGRSHAGYDLMPPDPARSDMTWSGAGARPLNLFVRGGAQAWPLGNTNWLANPLRPWARRAAAEPVNQRRPRRLNAVPVTNVVGWGKQTITTCTVNTGRLTFASSQEGDGTVPAGSAGWLQGGGVTTVHVPFGNFESHGKLWDSPAVSTVMREVLLGQAPASEFVHAGVSVSGRQARFCVVAANPAGRRLPGARFEVRGHVAAQAIADSRGVATAAAPVRRIVGPRRTPRRVTVRFTWTGGQKDVRVRVRP